MSNSVLVQDIGRARVITFNRPAVRSPLSIDVLEHLAVVIADMAGDRNVARLIFTGVDDIFASGADLREIADVLPQGAAGFALRGQALMATIESLKIDTIAAVNGICFGGALDLILACRRRIASPRAVFSHPGANLGIITGWGGTQRLPRLVGETVALEMFFTAKRVTSNEALLSGLVDEVVDDPLQHALAG